MQDVQGQFQAIESFAIRAKQEFYIIGQLLEGNVQEQQFIHVQLNPSLAMTVRIKQVETVEVASEARKYLLLIVAADSEDINLLLGLNIGRELMKITVAGED